MVKWSLNDRIVQWLAKRLAQRCTWVFGSLFVLLSLSAAPDTVNAQTKYVSVSARALHTCGVLVDTGAVKCWGDNEEGQSSPPGGTFT